VLSMDTWGSFLGSWGTSAQACLGLWWWCMLVFLCVLFVCAHVCTWMHISLIR
jgi:hypothetical protein